MCDADGNVKLHAPAVSFTFTFINISSLGSLVFSINRSRGVVSLFKTPILHKNTFVKIRLINYKLVHSVLCRDLMINQLWQGLSCREIFDVVLKPTSQLCDKSTVLFQTYTTLFYFQDCVSHIGTTVSEALDDKREYFVLKTA